MLDRAFASRRKGGEQVAPAGTWIEVPAGTPHGLSGAGRYLRLRA